MLDFEEELEKFQPSLDVEQAEDVIYNNNMTDITDIMRDLLKDNKQVLVDDLFTDQEEA